MEEEKTQRYQENASYGGERWKRTKNTDIPTKSEFVEEEKKTTNRNTKKKQGCGGEKEKKHRNTTKEEKKKKTEIPRKSEWSRICKKKNEEKSQLWMR